MFKPLSSTLSVESVSALEAEGWSFENTGEQQIVGSALRLTPLTGDVEPVDLAWPLVPWTFEDEFVNADLTSNWEILTNVPSLAVSSGKLRSPGISQSGYYLNLVQDTGGTGHQLEWPDNVDNEIGWTLQFRLSTNDTTPDNHYLEFDDGVNTERIYFTDTGMTFENNPDLNLSFSLTQQREIRIGMQGNEFTVSVDDGRGTHTTAFQSGAQTSPHLKIYGSGPTLALWDYVKFSTNGMIVDVQPPVPVLYSEIPRSATTPTYTPKRSVRTWAAVRALASGSVSGGSTSIDVEYKSSTTPVWTFFDTLSIDQIGWNEMVIDNIPTAGDGTDSIRLVVTQVSNDGTEEPPRIEEIAILANFENGSIDLFPSWGHRAGGYTVAVTLSPDADDVNTPESPDSGFVTVVTEKVLGSTSAPSDLGWNTFSASAGGDILSGWTEVDVGTPILIATPLAVEDGSDLDTSLSGQSIIADEVGDGIQRAWSSGGIEFYLEILTGEVEVSFGASSWYFEDSDYSAGRTVSLNLSGSDTLSILAASADAEFTVGRFRSFTGTLNSNSTDTGSYSDTGEGLSVDFFLTVDAYDDAALVVDGGEWAVGLTEGGFPYVDLDDGVTSDSLTGGIPVLIGERTNVAFSVKDFGAYKSVSVFVDGTLCGNKQTAIDLVNSTVITHTASCPATVENLRVYNYGFDGRDFCIDNGFTQPIFEDAYGPPPDGTNVTILRAYEKRGTIADYSGYGNHAYVSRHSRKGVHQTSRIQDEPCLTLWGDGVISIPHTDEQVIGATYSIYLEGIFYSTGGASTLFSKFNGAGTVGVSVGLDSAGKVLVTAKDGVNTRTLTSTDILADGQARSLYVEVSSTGLLIMIDEESTSSSVSIGSLAAATEDADLGPDVFAYIRVFVIRDGSLTLAQLQDWRDVESAKWDPTDKITIDGVDVDQDMILHWNSNTKFVLMPDGDPGQVLVSATVHGDLVLAASEPFLYTYGYAREIPEDKLEAISGTKSPFRILNRVPDGSVNLALIQSPASSSDANVSTLDLSFMELENLSTYHGGEYLLTGGESGEYDVSYSGQLDSDDLVLSTDSVVRRDISEPYPLYYQYLIGRGRHYVYQPGAEDTGDIGLIRDNIILLGGNGGELSFNDFPWDVKVCTTDVYGDDLPDNVFSVLLLTNKKFIPGSSVLVKYYSVDSIDDWSEGAGREEIVNATPIFSAGTSDTGDYQTEHQTDNTFTVTVIR